MAMVVGVRFRTAGKIYDFDPETEMFLEGEYVIVETARGIECGEVIRGNHEVADQSLAMQLKPVQRRATTEDIAHHDENSRKEKDARGVCLERIQRHKLDMKLVDVEYTFDNSKILFYFTADGRVDFRDLVKDLASVFRMRIELRQIGVRDEAKMMGAIGTCGRELCCSTFLSEFHPVSIKMAKEQSLSLNPTKISGTCGRLMCCLKYETDAYSWLLKRSPRVDAIVMTPQGQGTVVMVCLLKETVKVLLDTENGSDLVEIRVEDLEIIRDGSKRASGRRRDSSGDRNQPKGKPDSKENDDSSVGAEVSGSDSLNSAQEGHAEGGRNTRSSRNRRGGRNRDGGEPSAGSEPETSNEAAVPHPDTTQPTLDWNDAVIEVLDEVPGAEDMKES